MSSTFQGTIKDQQIANCFVSFDVFTGSGREGIWTFCLIVAGIASAYYHTVNTNYTSSGAHNMGNDYKSHSMCLAEPDHKIMYTGEYICSKTYEEIQICTGRFTTTFCSIHSWGKAHTSLKHTRPVMPHNCIHIADMSMKLRLGLHMLQIQVGMMRVILF